MKKRQRLIQNGKMLIFVPNKVINHSENTHYNTLHTEKNDKYEEATRFAMLYDLKSKLSKQKSLFLKSATNERENLTACYEVCLESVKQISFRDR
jgi:Leucine-rich repeat (LRR) protein